MDVDDGTNEMTPQQALEQASDIYLAKIKQDMSQALAQSREYRATFESRLYKTWKPALDLFEIVVILAYDAGAKFNKKHLQSAAKERNLVFKILTSLHARACLTASEVGALLRSGHAAGALTRQRTLHELAVVGYLIREHGQDLAKHYLDHEIIESVKAAADYQRHYRRLGYEPLEARVIERLHRQRAALIERYGRHFGDPYGWADHLLRKKHHKEDKRFTFTDLEAAVQLEHLRPYYRLASHGIHAGSKGDNFNIGNLNPRRTLLAGPSNAGLADPGHAALISLLQCTSFLLNSALDEETLVTLHTLGRLVDETGQEFLKVHNALMEAEAGLNQEMRDSSDR